ncbi:hypothetical protein [Corynebacterium riegelii]|uniref:PH domain-containing protein n=1 Tax=Corynebacterium riegelii TaxID=156976 RepID=A0A0K1RAV8_9CORY|nr:hypothetical protein [Corynebacterium riegelii]AKV58544.1 hypothetical protein AK829_04435 [Corynebacterium riegelii]
MNERLHWEKKSVNWALAVGLAVLFFIVLAIVMERLWAGVAVAVIIAVVFALMPDKRWADFDGQTLRLGQKKPGIELPRETIASVSTNDAGDLVVQTTAGEHHTLKSGGDADGLRAFAQKVQAAL